MIMVGFIKATDYHQFLEKFRWQKRISGCCASTTECSDHISRKIKTSFQMDRFLFLVCYSPKHDAKQSKKQFFKYEFEKTLGL